VGIRRKGTATAKSANLLGNTQREIIGTTILECWNKHKGQGDVKRRGDQPPALDRNGKVAFGIHHALKPYARGQRITTG
jgi:hypothetical protein